MNRLARWLIDHQDALILTFILELVVLGILFIVLGGGR